MYRLKLPPMPAAVWRKLAGHSEHKSLVSKTREPFIQLYYLVCEGAWAAGRHMPAHKDIKEKLRARFWK